MQPEHSIEIIHQIAELLITEQSQLCTAESCTGGLIAKSCTDIAGSSNWFDRGFVTYSNLSKIEMLDVQSGTLAENGAVSEAVVREMALGAIKKSAAQYAVAVTGIAGPDGGSVQKPVGTVWFGFAAQQRVTTEHRVFAGDRAQVREQSMRVALSGLLRQIRNK